MKYITVLLYLFSALIYAEEIVFEGTPTKKIEVTAELSSTKTLDLLDQRDFKVVISKVGNNYYWKTRGNTELIPIESGAYLTYVAKNGSGYVRTYTNEMLTLLNKLPKEQRNEEYLYIEHLVHQLGSITYYGK